MENQSLLQEDYLKVLEKIEDGTVVKGRVVGIFKDHVLLDIGYKSEGFIKKDEFNSLPQLGDILEVLVEKRDSNKGPLLSIKKLEALDFKNQVENYINERKIFKGRVILETEQGYKVELSNGLKGFLPKSLSKWNKSDKLSKGNEIEFYINSCENKKEQSLILDRKNLEREKSTQIKEKLLLQYNVGDIVSGKVKKILEYGAIINLGEINGFLHKSKIAWAKVDDIEKYFSEGDTLELKVININSQDGKIDLSLKDLKANPWDNVDFKYRESDIVKAKVIDIINIGAIVELEEGINGFIHISNFSWVKKVEDPKEILKIGQLVDVKILEIKRDLKKIYLGLKQVHENPWNNIEEKYPKGSIAEGTLKRITRTGAFIELEEGIDGFISNENLSWQEDLLAKDFFKEGEVYSFKVLAVKKLKIDLGIRELSENPWQSFKMSYKKNDKIQVEILSKEDNTILVRVFNELNGILPKKQLALRQDKCEELFDNLELGSKLEVLILSIDERGKKILLSLKELDKQREKEDISRYIYDRSEEKSNPFKDLLSKEL